MKKSVSIILSIVCLFIFVFLATASGKKEANSPNNALSAVTDLPHTRNELGELVVPSRTGYAMPDNETAPNSDYQAALDQARSYLRYQSFSRKNLIDQLEYEGYTLQASEYAVDNCGADWNEQALKSAKSYVEFSAFSYNGLVNQLESDGFAESEVDYALENSSFDWNAEAVESAAKYIEYLDYNSREQIVNMLVFDGFTDEQAAYGAQQNGF